VTDLWWLDQVAAAADGHHFLYAPDDATGRSILRQLSDLTAAPVTVVGSREESPTQGVWTEGTCYAAGERREIQARTLVATRLTRRPCD
jgi:hypothetical protein